MKSESQFVNTLEDNIRCRGAPTTLISDRAQVEISKKVKDILRHLYIKDWQSEPGEQHQNACERRYQTIKRLTNTILDRTGSPAFLWLLCLMYVCFLLNNVAAPSHGAVPIQTLNGSTNDISPLLFFDGTNLSITNWMTLIFLLIPGKSEAVGWALPRTLAMS
jgi:transposase InsO family protein